VLTPELCDEHKNEEGTPMLLKPATSRAVPLGESGVVGLLLFGLSTPKAAQVLAPVLREKVSASTISRIMRGLG
jgi:hypothetical protein